MTRTKILGSFLQDYYITSSYGGRAVHRRRTYNNSFKCGTYSWSNVRPNQQNKYTLCKGCFTDTQAAEIQRAFEMREPILIRFMIADTLGNNFQIIQAENEESAMNEYFVDHPNFEGELMVVEIAPNKRITRNNVLIKDMR